MKHRLVRDHQRGNYHVETSPAARSVPQLECQCEHNRAEERAGQGSVVSSGIDTETV